MVVEGRPGNRKDRLDEGSVRLVELGDDVGEGVEPDPELGRGGRESRGRGGGALVGCIRQERAELCEQFLIALVVTLRHTRERKEGRQTLQPRHALLRIHLPLTFKRWLNASSMNARYMPLRRAGLSSPASMVVALDCPSGLPGRSFLRIVVAGGSRSDESEGRGRFPRWDWWDWSIDGVAERLIGFLLTGLERGAAAAIYIKWCREGGERGEAWSRRLARVEEVSCSDRGGRSQRRVCGCSVVWRAEEEGRQFFEPKNRKIASRVPRFVRRRLRCDAGVVIAFED
jgi:hypothetical protein